MIATGIGGKFKKNYAKSEISKKTSIPKHTIASKTFKCKCQVLKSKCQNA